LKAFIVGLQDLLSPIVQFVLNLSKSIWVLSNSFCDKAINFEWSIEQIKPKACDSYPQYMWFYSYDLQCLNMDLIPNICFKNEKDLVILMSSLYVIISDDDENNVLIMRYKIPL